MKRGTLILAGLIAAGLLVVGAVWLGQNLLTPKPVEADRRAAGLGMAVAGDYLTLASPQAGQTLTGPVRVEAVLTNPDPDYWLNLVLYIPNPPGLRYRQGSAVPIAKVLNTAQLPGPDLPPPAQGEEIVQGAIWHGEVPTASSLTLTLEYDLVAPLPPTVILRGIVYDGLDGTPAGESSLVFRTDPGQPLPVPTPRYSLTPAAIPDKPAGMVFSPTLAVNLQSNSTDSHVIAVQGVNGIGAGTNLIAFDEATHPYQFRMLTLTQCYFLDTWIVNRAALEFDTTTVPANFTQATLRLRALPPYPDGHTIEVRQGQWEWVRNLSTNAEGQVTADTVNPAVWVKSAPPLATLPVTGTTATLTNLPLPRSAITPGGVTRLLLTSSAEADTPQPGSCFTGLPGLGGAITLPELYIQ